MIIADTNVWVSFFKGEARSRWLREAIIEDRVALHPYIYGELLLGGVVGKAAQLLPSLEMIQIVEVDMVFSFIKKNRLQGRGVGWVDVNILASALAGMHRVSTYDGNLLALCRSFGCHSD